MKEKMDKRESLGKGMEEMDKRESLGKRMEKLDKGESLVRRGWRRWIRERD